MNNIERCPTLAERIRNFDLRVAMWVLPILGSVLLLILYWYGDKRWVQKENYERDQQRMENILNKLEDGQKKIIEYLINKGK
jgi:hypothetical protein